MYIEHPAHVTNGGFRKIGLAQIQIHLLHLRWVFLGRWSSFQLPSNRSLDVVVKCDVRLVSPYGRLVQHPSPFSADESRGGSSRLASCDDVTCDGRGGEAAGGEADLATFAFFSWRQALPTRRTTESIVAETIARRLVWVSPFRLAFSF